jgi:hypothetical protein
MVSSHAPSHYQIGLQKIISQSFIFYAFKKNYFIFVKSIFWGGRRQQKKWGRPNKMAVASVPDNREIKE